MPLAPTVELAQFAAETDAARLAPTPPVIPTLNDGYTEYQRLILQELNIYEEILELPPDNNLQESVLGLIDVLWLVEDEPVVGVEKVKFERTDFDPTLPSNVINKEQYYIWVLADDRSAKEKNNAGLYPGTLIFWNDREENISIRDLLLVYEPKVGETLRFTVIRGEDGSKYRGLVSVNEETGASTAYTDPTGAYWIEPINNPEIAVFTEEERGFYSWSRIDSSKETNSQIYWEELGELLPEQPEEADGVRVYSERDDDGEIVAYLVTIDSMGEIKYRYQLIDNENKGKKWVSLAKIELQSQAERITEGLQKQGYEVNLNEYEEIIEIWLSKVDRFGELKFYYFGELSIDHEIGEVLFSISEIEGEEKIFPAARVDIGEYTIEKLTEDGGREEFIKYKTRILTSDGRPYYEFMPEDLRLTKTEWGKVGVEIVDKVSYTNDAGELLLTVAIGEGFLYQDQPMSWNDDLPDFEYADPFTGETYYLSPPERFRKAYEVGLWLGARANGYNDGLTLTEVQNGTIVIIIGKDGELFDIDTSEEFAFIFTNDFLVTPYSYDQGSSWLGKFTYDYEKNVMTAYRSHFPPSPERGHFWLSFYYLTSMVSFSFPDVFTGESNDRFTNLTPYDFDYPDREVWFAQALNIYRLVFELREGAKFDPNWISISDMMKSGRENMLIHY